MKATSKLFLAFGLTTIFFACSQDNKEQFISSSAAVENEKDTTHKFIRTSELKFKVKNVIESTYKIEDITNQFNGFVTYTNLKSNIDNKTIVPVSADSSLETIYYTVVNEMKLRVPKIKLDTTLKSIATQIDFLDYRIIKADDASPQLLSNKLTQERNSKSEQRIINSIDKRGKKLNETTNANELLSVKQEQSDNAKISNLMLQDQIDFSTISLYIYQRQAIKREFFSNDKNIDAYTPEIGSRILEALKSGWEVLENLIVGITRLWSIILIIFIGVLFYKRFNQKNLQKSDKFQKESF